MANLENKENTTEDIFKGIEDQDGEKSSKEKEILKGNFIIIDGKKVEIDNSSLFSVGENDSSKEIIINNNSFDLKGCVFSSDKFKIEKQESSEEEFSYKKREDKVNTNYNNNSNYNKKNINKKSPKSYNEIKIIDENNYEYDDDDLFSFSVK